MNREISKLPLEIQQHIRDSIPQFTRLSKNIYVGRDIFYQQCYDPINKHELLDYVETHHVESFILYSTDINFYIDLYQLNPPKTFLWFEYGAKTYNLTRYVLYVEDFNYSIVVEHDQGLNIKDILNLYQYIECDLVTSFDVINYTRKECFMIKDFIKKFAQIYLDNIIKPSIGSDSDKIRNKSISLIYLLTNFCMLILNYDDLFTGIIRINYTLEQIQFNKDGQMINGNGIKLLDSFYNLHLEIFHKYILKL